MRLVYEHDITISDSTSSTSLKGYEAAVDGTFKVFSTPMTKQS